MVKSWTLVQETAPPNDCHVIPSWEPHHELSGACDCAPKIDYQDPVTGIRVWTHTARDEAN